MQLQTLYHKQLNYRFIEILLLFFFFSVKIFLQTLFLEVSKMKTRAKIFGENLERIMKEKRISRKELANVLGVSVPAIFTYIHGVKQPALDKIFTMADFFQVSVSSLIGDNDYNISLPSNASIDKIILEYRYSHALKLANAANFDIQEYRNGYSVSIPATFQHVENDGTISVISGIEIYKIKDRFSLVRIIEIAEMQAIKLNTPIHETFKSLMIDAKKID